jgi:hypothetical protein
MDPREEVTNHYQALIDQATVRARQIRDLAPVSDTVILCGIKIKQPTLRDYQRYITIGSSILSGGVSDIEDVIDFLIHQSRVKTRIGKWRLVRKLKGSGIQAITEVQQFIEDVFMDATRSGEDVPDYPWSFSERIVRELSSSYSWSRDAVLDCPLSIIFQHLQMIRHDSQIESGKKAIVLNPPVDRLWSLYLREIEAINRAEMEAKK